MCRVFWYYWKMMSAMTSAFSWQNSVRLCPDSFCTPRPHFSVTLGISWLSTFAFQAHMMKRTSFFGDSSIRSCSLSWNFQLLLHWWLWHRRGLLWYWMVCLGNEQRSFCCFQRLHPTTAFLSLLLTMRATPLPFRVSCPQ